MSTLLMIGIALVVLFVYLLYRAARWLGRNSGRVGRSFNSMLDDLGDIGDIGDFGGDD